MKPKLCTYLTCVYMYAKFQKHFHVPTSFFPSFLKLCICIALQVSSKPFNILSKLWYIGSSTENIFCTLYCFHHLFTSTHFVHWVTFLSHLSTWSCVGAKLLLKPVCSCLSGTVDFLQLCFYLYGLLLICFFPVFWISIFPH